jgi:hypothetical protein
MDARRVANDARTFAVLGRVSLCRLKRCEVNKRWLHAREPLIGARRSIITTYRYVAHIKPTWKHVVDESPASVVDSEFHQDIDDRAAGLSFSRQSKDSADDVRPGPHRSVRDPIHGLDVNERRDLATIVAGLFDITVR